MRVGLKSPFSKVPMQWNVLESRFILLLNGISKKVNYRTREEGEKNLSSWLFHCTFCLVSLWHGEVTAIAVYKMKLFNSPSIHGISFEMELLFIYLLFRAAKILVAPTFSLTLVSWWSSLNSIDESTALCLSDEKLFFSVCVCVYVAVIQHFPLEKNRSTGKPDQEL